MPIFTTSLFLLSGLAIVVPIALHLLHRRKPQPILFGAVRFMRDAIAKSRRSRRLTQGLTLLMRCLILLLLAFGFAQPFVRQGDFLPEGKRKLLLVLDGSASMQARDGDLSFFVKGQRWIGQVLDGLSEGDQVGLLIVCEQGGVSVVPPIADHAHLRTLVDEAVCSQGEIDLASRIRMALGEDGEQFKDFELHIFSDFQRGSWQAESAKLLSIELEKRHTAVFLNSPVSGNISDAGVVDLSFSPSAIVGDGPYSCRYTLGHTENYSGSLTVRLEGEGREQDQLTAVLPGAELSERLTGQADTTDSRVELVGRVMIDEDSYSLNDSRYYSLARLSGQPAMVVNGSGDSRDSFFLTRALKPTGVSFSHVEPVEKDWSGLLNTSDLSEYAMLFICNPPSMDEAAVSHIRKYVEGGGMVVFFPGGGNGLDERTIRALSGNHSIGVPAELLPEETRFQLTSEQTGHDVLRRRLVKMLPPPWELSIRRRLPLSSGGSLPRFISYLQGDKFDGKEFLLRCPVGNGEMFFCSLSANRDWSEMPLTPFYFVLVQELSRHGAGFRHRDLDVAIGGELSLPLQGTFKEDAVVVATDGNGRKVELKGVLDNSGKSLVLSGFHVAGIYTVELPWGVKKLVSVNIPDSESSLTYWGSEELLGGDQFGQLHVSYSLNHDQLRRQMSLAGRSRPLSPWLLLAAFGLSMIEVLYANIRSRRPSQPRLVENLLKNGGGVS